jgi:hypothetical protein
MATFFQFVDRCSAYCRRQFVMSFGGEGNNLLSNVEQAASSAPRNLRRPERGNALQEAMMR